MRIDTKYDIGETVYLKTDPEQKQMIIAQICVKPIGHEYDLRFGTQSSWHFEMEFNKEKDILKSIE